MNIKRPLLFVLLLLLPLFCFAQTSSLDANLDKLEELILTAENNSKAQSEIIDNLSQSLEQSESELKSKEEQCRNLEKSLTQISQDYQKLYSSYEKSNRRCEIWKNTAITVTVALPVAVVVTYLIMRNE